MSYIDTDDEFEELVSVLRAKSGDAVQYGTPRKSGRYPYGSGKDPSTKNHRDFLDYIDGLKKEGLTDKEIYTALDITSTKYRQLKSIAKNELKQAQISQAQRLRDKGMGSSAIGRQMGIPESTVRTLLDQSVKDKALVIDSTANMIKDAVDEKKYVDVSGGVEHGLNISYTKLKTVVSKLEDEGYKVHYVKIPQQGTVFDTNMKVLTKGDVSYSEVLKNRDNIQQIQGQFTDDGGRSWFGVEKPLSISSRRVQIVYAEDGGGDRDGVMFVRPGKKDVSLDGAQYAQVRVMVDGTHYLKGMAVHKADLPEGVDIQFHTNKRKADLGPDKHAAMKEVKRIKETGEVDPDNPFGSMIDRQIGPKGPDGRIKPSSVMNLVNEEGKWGDWNRTLSSQFLSKQSPLMAKQQLQITQERRRETLDEILALNNPAVKRKLLDGFAEDADAAASHLKAAPLPGQVTKVLMPLPSLKPTEAYAPTFPDGTRLALVRFPHGGKFEIPDVVVNNRNREGRALLGTAPESDVIGIHPTVAKRLSGADFDGDTVLAIPNNSGKVRSEPGLRELANFDPQHEFPGYEGMEVLREDRKQQLMGDVSNLITDMTIKGASNAELARAVKHSMVIIDAEKHKLNYKLSAEVNGITALKKRYQARPDGRPGGASTIVSRKKSKLHIPERRPARVSEGGPIDKETGKINWVDTGRVRIDQHGNPILDKHGNPVLKTTETTKLRFTDDANTIRGTDLPIERIYADHSNALKAMANEARKASVNTKNTPYSTEANLAYKKEAESLKNKLNLALRNRPLERQAQIIAGARVAAKRRQYPDMSEADLKKTRSQAIAEARVRTGAKKQNIEIEPNEWNAIQAGAITNNLLEGILRNTDLEAIKKLATPREAYVMTSPKLAQAKSMLAAGYTPSEVAERLGVNVSTLKSAVSDGE